MSSESEQANERTDERVAQYLDPVFLAVLDHSGQKERDFFISLFFLAFHCLLMSLALYLCFIIACFQRHPVKKLPFREKDNENDERESAHEMRAQWVETV